ncbi:MAG TPA: hypothetical protein PLL26_04140 [Candidatus Dojkabacteria bacterium]|nr:hypothetical protein [Candidatus Dojkabacteria bacterium]
MSSVSNPIISSSENVYDLIKDGKTLSTKIPYSHPKKTGGKVMNLTLGRIWFNQLLPHDYPLVNEAVTKKKMDDIIANIYKIYGTEEATEIISKLQTEAFKLATLSPNSFNIDIFIPPTEWVKKKEEFEETADKLSPPEFKKEAESLTKELIKYIEESGSRIENIMASGAKGNPISDWGALLVAKGYVMDIEGNLLGPITTGLNDGYEKIDYYNAGSEARKNFYMRSALTAHPGYLTRKMVNANAGLQIDQKLDDCGSKHTFDLVVTEDLADLLLQRNYISQTGTIKNITSKDQILDKKIKLRSPLYCLSENGICPTCYGNLYKTLNTKNIGILAGGAVNVVGINAMMKMRHQSSSINTKEVDFIDMIKSAGIDIKTFSQVLDIKKTEIFAKIPCSIIIDSSEYDDVSLIDCGDKYQIVGVLTIQYGVAQNISFITLPFTIMLDCFKPTSIDVDGNIITMNYEPGELMISQKYYDDTFNERTVDRLFEGGAKYITNPEVLVITLHNKLAGIDLVHLETIVSNMFRDAEDLTIPARLTNYKNITVIGQKKLPYVISWLSALSFENINRAIKVGLIENKHAKLDPLEHIILEKYGQEE